jgi:hypothetical protein
MKKGLILMRDIGVLAMVSILSPREDAAVTGIRHITSRPRETAAGVVYSTAQTITPHSSADGSRVAQQQILSGIVL